MTMYQCIYLDVKHGNDIETEMIESSDLRETLQMFIRHRKKEGWSLAEIFVRCSLEVRSIETNALYHMNKYGELEKDRPYWEPHTENV